MDNKGTTRLETNRLVLRRFNLEDVEASYNNWMSDEKVTEFLRWTIHKDINETAKVIEEWIESYKHKNFYQWAIVLKDTKEPIGNISVVDSNEKIGMVHIGYCIGSKWWNMRYTTEAFKAIIKFLFEEIKVNRIESMHDPNNPNSGKVMKKCGLKYEGTLRKADWSNKGIVDVCIYGLLSEDYYKINK